jgi:sugar diacid utilization regulator
MVLASARVNLTPEQSRPERARTLHLTSIIAATAGRGGQYAARQFLQPLIDHDAAHHGELVHTLRTFIRCDVKPLRTAEALHTHRNTLRYRLGQISRLLDLDLYDLDVLVMCSLALRLLDTEGGATPPS